jgi:four helix bundle protein
MQSFRELNCWKEAREFRNIIFELTQRFPSDEKYRLTDQIIRSSRGIGNAVAEGHGRYHFQENIQYCRIGRGSLEESLDHLITALDCRYISQSEFNEYEQKYKSILALLNGYIAYLKKRKGGETN